MVNRIQGEFALRESRCVYGGIFGNLYFIKNHSKAVIKCQRDDDEDGLVECDYKDADVVDWEIVGDVFGLGVCSFRDGGRDHLISVASGDLIAAAKWLEEEYPVEWAAEVKFAWNAFADERDDERVVVNLWLA